MLVSSLERLGAAALLLGGLGATAAQAATYRIVDLGSKFTTGINDRGEISANSNGDHAFVYRQDHWRPLPDHGTASLAVAINAGGDVAGSDDDRPGFWPRGGAFTPLSLPPDATGAGYAMDISNHQVVVGYYATSSAAQGQGCFRWSAAQGGVDLGLMGHGDYCFAAAINEAGRIVGDADIQPGGLAHAFVYEDGAFQDLGTLGGADTHATDVNRQGHVVGWTASGTSFLWKGGRMIDVRAGSRYATVNLRSINDADELVGSATDSLGQSHAVRFASGRFTDLESEVDKLRDWQLKRAIAINNSGVIVGWGFRTDDQGLHYFKLVPLEQP